MSGNLREWTADELLIELRRRERISSQKRADADERAREPAASGRAADLQAVPTEQLAKLARDRQRVIYGVDDRKDLYQVRSRLVRQAAGAVVALVKAADLAETADGEFELATGSYREQYQLCGNEPFASQPLGCFCSGFLVGPDVIASAGHCVKSQADLAGLRFVFGFRMIDAESARTTFPAADVYSGVELIGRQLASDGTDWALVKLDRAVEGRTPVRVRATGKIGSAQSLFVIGHPCGLPQKYAPGAKVRDNTPAPYFVANLDTYGGNSGSPVFNASNGVVEGILVRGENDFVSNGTCYVSLVCPTTGCRGEDVTRSAIWAAKIPTVERRRGRSPTASEAKTKTSTRGRKSASSRTKRKPR